MPINKIKVDLLRTLVSKTQVGMVLTDAKGFIVWANEFILQIGEFELHEVLGKKPGAVFQGKDTNPEHVDQIRNGLASEKSFNVTILNYSKSGSSYWIKLQISPIHDDLGRLTHFIGIQTDVSDFKEQEEKLIKFTDEVERHNQRLQNFNHIVSHNLVNQINNINGLIRLVYTQLPLENRDMLKLSSAQLVDTVNHLKQLLRVERGDKNWLQNEVDLGALINKVIATYENEVLEKGISILLKGDSDNIIKSNQAYLESVLSNLISNAIKYRRLAVPLEVEVFIKKSVNTLEISVSDNGRGIDLSSAGSQLFEIFSPINPVSGSLGLGLYLVKSQLDELGGNVLVESEPNKGSKFTIYLPMH